MWQERITEKNKEFLFKEYGKTFEEIENMTDKEYDDFTTFLAFEEADATTDDEEMSERERLIGEIIDVICGPYDDDDEEDDDDDYTWE